jgi:ribonuclease J
MEPSEPRLRVIPLGGCGEVGLNATLLVSGNDAILIDCGALVGVWDAPGIERAIPRFTAITERGRRLLGVVLTHGHEDHVGALPGLLAELDPPIFGTPTTIAFARSRLERSSVERAVRDKLTAVPLGGRIDMGPFSVELVRVTHSIPESAALAITTPAGVVLHSGDFKLDEAPFDGQRTDVDRLRALGDRGVDLLLSDSTNAEVPGRARSERDVAVAIGRILVETRGRVIVALFASHIHRVAALAEGARASGRRILLVGRALSRAWEIGVEQGLLPSDPTLLLTPEGAAMNPRREVLVLATGTQGELAGGLARIAAADHPPLKPLAEDCVVISARTIPGNEKPVRRILNLLARRGVPVVHDRMAPVHCSGHAHYDEQAELMRIVRPQTFIPIHGERTMLEAHARIAAEVGIERTLVIEDGQSADLSAGRVDRGDDEPAGKRLVDPAGLWVDLADVRDRRAIGRNGLLVCSVVVDPRGAVRGTPAVTGRGLSIPPNVRRAITDLAIDAVRNEPASSNQTLEIRVRSAILSSARRLLGAQPALEVHVVTVGADGVV